MIDNRHNKIIENANEVDCISEMCKQKPHLILRTQCGIGKYMFMNFCFKMIRLF